MTGVFVIQGWHAAAGVVVEEVVAAEDAQAAKARARARDLTMITVRPYAPVGPAVPEIKFATSRLPGPRRPPSTH